MAEFALISFKDFDPSAGPDQKAVQDLRVACNRLGFFYLVDHGISQEDIDRAFRLEREYFSTDINNKRQNSWDAATNHGYSDFSQEKLDPTSPENDYKESFNFAKFVGKSPQFPDVFQAEAQFIQQFQQSCHNLCLRILQAFALALRIDQDVGGATFFDSRHQFSKPCGSILRLLHYPPLPTNTAFDHLRAGCHSDYGSITLLFQQDIGGLQVLTNQGWTNALPQPRTIVVNTGDLMEFWTGGLFPSTLHRVVAGPTPDVDRYSIAYFCHPNDDTPLQSIPHAPLEIFDHSAHLRGLSSEKRALPMELQHHSTCTVG